MSERTVLIIDFKFYLLFVLPSYPNQTSFDVFVFSQLFSFMPWLLSIVNTVLYIAVL
jgi:hypothetical protein